MLINYLLTAYRTFRSTRVFSLINIFGLAIGISATLVIYLIVHFDLSFEDFQPNRDRIYRVVTDANFDGESFNFSGVPYPLPVAARKDLTGITEGTAIWPTSPRVTISRPGQPYVIKEQNHITYTDAHYFKLFKFYTWLAGSGDALDAPFHVVLSANRAAAYFPGLAPSQVIGKPILYGDSTTAVVTGVVSDPPLNTDFSWQEFVSISTIAHTRMRQYADPDDWNGINGASQFMVELAPGTTPASIDRQLIELRKKYVRSENVSTYKHRLQPLADIHFNAGYDTFFQRIANKPTLHGLMLVAAFLLVLGCINFINLATAQAARRAKEIGIRKTLGGSQRQLLFQFLSETFLLTLLSLGLSLVLTPWLLRVFSDFIPPQLHLDLYHQPQLLLFLLILLLTVTILAGFYPAWVLSRFKPVIVLKSQAYTGSNTTRSAMLRKVLTISQFVIAQAFIMATLIVGRQLHYSLTADLGFKKDAIVDFTVPFTYGYPDNKRFLLLDRLRSIPGIERASSGGPTPSTEGTMTNDLRYTDGKKDIRLQVQVRYGDSNFIKVYHLPLLAGHNLRASDTTREFIINRSYCSILGFKNPADALGRTVMDGNASIPIVGVIPDFHQSTLHTPIKPLVIACSLNDQFFIHLALQPDANHWNATLSQVEKAYKDIYPSQDFTFEFLDQAIAKYYVAEQQLSRLLQWATALTILISCLGLAGLVIFTTNVRTKEIGIRKILGASVTAIVTLLSKEFVNLLLIAFVIATPVAWWALHRWLEGFAYRVPVSWWIFPLAGGAMIAFALLTMSIRTIRSAMANPVDSLRSE
jgi:putative ABC transport system permease protein